MGWGRLQDEPEGIGVVPLVKGCVDGGFLSAVNVSLEQVLSGVGHVEERWLLFPKTIDEKLGVKLRPFDMRKFLDERIYTGGARDIVESVDAERGYQGLSKLPIRAWDNWIETSSPEDV